MNKKKSLLAMGLVVALAFSLMATPLCVGAASKDVTKEKKTEVKKIMNQLTDSLVTYLAAVPESKPYKFRFNNRTKTVIILYHQFMTDNKFSSDLDQYDEKAANKLIVAKMQNLFGSKAKFDLSSKAVGMNKIFAIRKGKLAFKGGDWGEMGPAGKVTKIMQVNKKTLCVTYHVGVAGGEDNEFRWMGDYTITLKKNVKSNYGYIVSGIKLADYLKK